ncbi:MAG: NAD(P)/FAD-dependent oxidoreductase [Rhodospirillales bacterium]|jgi:NAD(P)H-nitrite reductase large subunit|nr:NAD(P)/FAD-dependent oxidoreductase [Rhodospirillales bacterium]MBT4040549.1 NAD(P)/FAD-dependent oxidoreductase [Rhodospirillales bacterium]MBT4626994.1 NAD(P)/FAD-dependent oxidoreductase [Rhodospirillales bacterium]MBT5352247.1 NAD(P)/FAD-dependent oxidoreductase [Rhodospirillales bacterium]MBT5519972.1 NAD(P)/FAD-dependent oxidoreductase [Rhodospirillales bacterium]
MNYVIIGAGPAGVVAAETLRKNDPEGDITMISGEGASPYSRMAIPYFLTGKIEESGTHLRKAKDHYDSNSIKVIAENVSKVDTKKSTVTLSNGDSVSYDKLLIASGATPVKPPVPGLDRVGVHHCWTLEDAHNIVKHAVKGSDVVLMGAGFIGCIILESLLARGVNLTVVEAEDRMVPRMMNQIGGTMIKDWCIAKGANVLTSTRATSVDEADGKLAVTVDSGDVIPADLVVVATGVKSNTDFLDGTDIKMEDGILIDDHFRTNVDNVYAAGDCAKGREFNSDGWAVHAIQPTATEHGRIAAVNMTGGDCGQYRGSLSMNVLDTAGLVTASFGQWEGVGGDGVETVDKDNFRYMRLEFDKDDMLVGALSLGRTDQVGCIRGLIQARKPMGKWKARLLEDPNRIAEAYVGLSQ